jgi:hypothetical protein
MGDVRHFPSPRPRLKRQPWAAPAPKPKAVLFEFVRGSARYHVELRDHGEWGTEAQFFCEGQLHFGCMWTSREQAIRWATHKRAVMEIRGNV